MSPAEVDALRQRFLSCPTSLHQELVHTLRKLGASAPPDDEIPKNRPNDRQAKQALFDILRNYDTLSYLPQALDHVYPPSKTIERPFVNIPADPRFHVTRGTELDWLFDMLMRAPKGVIRQPICGIAGIGKTSFVLNYARRYQHQYSSRILIGASRHEHLAGAFVPVAARLGCKEGAEAAVPHVSSHLEALQQEQPWLLIIDGLSNLEESALSQLPQEGFGHILLTMRPDISEYNVFAPAVRLGTLEEEDALRFLSWGAGTSAADSIPGRGENPEQRQEQAAARQIVEKLGCYPLALHQAGQWLAKNKTARQRFSRYVQMLESASVDSPCRKGINAALSLIPEAVRKSADEILHICALLGREAIPIDLFRRYYTELRLPELREPGKLDECLAELERAVLLSRDARTDTFTVLRVAQLGLNQEMDSRSFREWSARAWEGLDALLDDMRPDGQSALANSADSPDSIDLIDPIGPIKPHVEALVEHISAQAALPLDGTKLRARTAQVLQRLGRVEPAKDLWSTSIRSQCDTLFQAQLLLVGDLLEQAALHHPEEPRKADLIRSRALRLLDGMDALLELQPDSAVPDDKIWKRQIETLKLLIGSPLSPPKEKADWCKKLGGLLSLDGKPTAESVAFFEQAYHIRSRLLGPDHYALADDLYNLATARKELQDYAEATQLLRRQLAILEHTLGSAHTELAAPLTTLAGVLSSLGEKEEAQRLLARARALPLPQDTRR